MGLKNEGGDNTDDVQENGPAPVDNPDDVVVDQGRSEEDDVTGLGRSQGMPTLDVGKSVEETTAEGHNNRKQAGFFNVMSIK